MSVKDWGVVIGRFQTPYLHDGHTKLLDYVDDQHEGRMLVVVGIRPALPSDINPLPFEIRASMIQERYPRAVVVPQSDYKEDSRWSQTLDHLIRCTTGNAPAIIYAGRDSFGKHYKGKFRVETLNFGMNYVSASNIREAIKPERYNQNATSFRAGMIYAYNQLPGIVYPTVDMAIVNPAGDSILMGRKPDESSLRFPGGMFDAGRDENYRVAASREAYEETRISVEYNAWDYVGDFSVQDWRSRGSNSHHWHTTFFATLLPWAHAAIADDDLVEVKWVPITTQMSHSSRLVEEHWMLWDAVVKFIQTNYTKRSIHVAASVESV